MPLRFEQLHPACGAEVIGLDLTNPLTPDVVEELRDGFARHRVLVARGLLDLPTEQHIRFVEAFGTPVFRGFTKGEGPGGAPTGVQYVSNTRQDGLLKDGELFFHHDQSFYDVPNHATTLYGIEVPEHGGETMFCNTELVYERLPATLREKLDKLTIMHVFKYGNDYNKPMEDTGGPDVSRALHPAVWIEPGTGRKALWMFTTACHHVVEMELEAGRQLIREISALIDNPAYYYKHKWQVGDLLIWDNWAVQHARADFDRADRRTLRRVPVLSTYRSLTAQPAEATA